MPRDEFTKPVKDRLAKRVGYLCSMPSCRILTVGPSDSRKSEVSNLGVAAHIEAASPEGPRYNPEMSPAERSSEKNGIWLCSNHGKLVDDNEKRYTVELLQGWRQEAEKRVAVTLRESRLPLGLRKLVPHRVTLTQPEIRTGVEEFLLDVGAFASWGQFFFDISRMVLFELALNAFDHAGVECVELSCSQSTVTLLDKGPKFNFGIVTTGGQGGRAAVQTLKKEAEGTLELIYRRTQGTNQWSIIDLILEDGAGRPCSISFSETPGAFGVPREDLEGCEEIHVYAHRLWSYSDLYEFINQVRAHFPETPLVFHGIDPASGFGKHILEAVPLVRLPDIR